MRDLVIVYYSQTGMNKRFLEKLREELDITCYRITESAKFVCNAPYVLVTPTYNFGQVPEQVQTFLESEETNRENLVAVVSNGNRNWGIENFGRAGALISEQYNVPWLHRYEMRGNSEDIKKMVEEIKVVRRGLNV